ncbi:MAG: lysozyme inhibitor LprI family protein [Hyphomicrobiales bacterium]
MTFFSQTLALAFALFAITSPHTAMAQSDDLDCSNPQNQSVMNRCAFLDFEAADVELNAIWPAARKANATFAEYLPDNLKADAQALLEAQRAWITFRDAHCASVALPNAGGTIYPLIYNSCRAGVTRQRTEQLRELVDNAR